MDDVSPSAPANVWIEALGTDKMRMKATLEKDQHSGGVCKCTRALRNCVSARFLCAKLADNPFNVIMKLAPQVY